MACFVLHNIAVSCRQSLEGIEELGVDANEEFELGIPVSDETGVAAALLRGKGFELRNKVAKYL